MEFGCQSKFKVWVSGREEHNGDNYSTFGQNKIVQKLKMAAILMFWKLKVTKYPLMAYYIGSVINSVTEKD